ncbi:hypothetical protein [Paracoccus laeviglucosivorans]|uniref:Predicted 5' DNA nuclease, flap endonuclease-1-like, helix-3-turn-helix (H3TH) domain n=1 Tax=Paracoccus laeviglucosivorans TaxID=1197861 RepID=A0A521AFM5_9RHOB|nr:hypothetical protein [Paracoccus laeviglucosivorans]SMO33568.1 Predicted 5' DNA nuclease, flap endonuclease-1-like, helix-3-turn-helix (H3TH) domain [Paracoccus laeviglucosivorans]
MEQSVCNRNCWISGAIAGVVVLLFTSGIGERGWAAGLFLGLVTFVLFGALMSWLVCHERPQLAATGDGMTSSDWERQVVERQPEALLVSAPLGGPEGYSSGAQMPIVAGALPSTPASISPREAEPQPKPVAKIAATADAGTAEDDLRRIKGVGPKLADWLKENGVTRFAQIAAWQQADIADFAQRLGRMGSRIEADDWVGQARILASGGETEHSLRVERGEST